MYRVSSPTSIRHLLSKAGCTLLLGIAAHAPLLHAEDTSVQAPSMFRLSGFGTFGLARSTSNQGDFVQELAQSKGTSGQWTARVDSKLGVQLNVRFTDQLEGVAQVVSRYRYDGSSDPELTWAFLRADLSPQLSVRVGRLGTEFFMLADSRMVGYSYLTVRPPVDYFSVLPLNYVDGIDASYTIPVDGGLFRAKVFTGYTGEKLTVIGQTWDLGGSPMRGIHLDYQRGPWLARIGYTDLRFSHEMPSGGLLPALEFVGFGQIAKDVAVRDKMNRLYSLGLVYDEGPLQAQLMLGYTKRESFSFEDTHNGYLTVGYRLNQITPFIGCSWIYSAPRQGYPAVAPYPSLDINLTSLLADAHSDQHTVFFGGRWDVTPTIALKAQVDLVRGQPSSRFTVRDDTGKAWTGQTNVYSLALDFIF